MRSTVSRTISLTSSTRTRASASVAAHVLVLDGGGAVGQAGRTGQGDEVVEHALELDGVGADERPLRREPDGDDPPPVVDLAEHVLGADPHVVEEDLAELLVAGHLPDRPDLDARAGPSG